MAPSGGTRRSWGALTVVVAIVLSLRAGALLPCGPALRPPWSAGWCVSSSFSGRESRGHRPDCGGSHCAQPLCWCIDSLQSHLVVVVVVLSLSAGASTPCMMVRLSAFTGGWVRGRHSALSRHRRGGMKSGAIFVSGLWGVGRLRLPKLATNDPWAGLQGRVGRSGRAPAQR